MPGTTSTALSSFSHAWPAPQNRCGQTERRNQCYKELDLLVYLLIYSGAKIFVVNITRWSNLKEKGEQKMYLFNYSVVAQLISTPRNVYVWHRSFVILSKKYRVLVTSTFSLQMLSRGDVQRGRIYFHAKRSISVLDA